MKELDENESNFLPVCSTPKATQASNTNDYKYTFYFSSGNEQKERKNKGDKSIEEIIVEPKIITDIHVSSVHEQNDNIDDKKCYVKRNSESLEEIMPIEVKNEESIEEREFLATFQKQRDDVVNKTMLRAIRRFYSNLFKRDNITIIRKRFRNATSDEFIIAIKDMIKKYILPNLSTMLNKMNWNSSDLGYLSRLLEQDDSEELNNLAVFLLRFIGFKPKDCAKYGRDIETKGEQIQSCMYSYSHPKLLSIRNINELKIIFKWAFMFHLEKIFVEDTTLFIKRKEYMTAFKNFDRLLSIKHEKIISI